MADNRFTSTALGAIRLAQENAARLGHSYVGSEHLLLGLASQEYSMASRLLREAGADSQTLRAAIAQLVGTGVPNRTLHQGLTPQCCQVIQRAAAESRRLHQTSVSAEHQRRNRSPGRHRRRSRNERRPEKWRPRGRHPRRNHS